MGIARLFYADARPALERGALTLLLRGWRLPGAVPASALSSSLHLPYAEQLDPHSAYT